MDDNPKRERRRTPYFIPKTAPPTREGVERLRSEFHKAVAQAQSGLPSADAVEFAIQLLREVRAAEGKFAGQCGVAIEALSTLIPEGHRTAMSPDEARSWAWEQIKRDVGTDGWTVGDSINYYGFFCHGWRTRGQYDEQRSEG